MCFSKITRTVLINCSLIAMFATACASPTPTAAPIVPTPTQQVATVVPTLTPRPPTLPAATQSPTRAPASPAAPTVAPTTAPASAPTQPVATTAPTSAPLNLATPTRPAPTNTPVASSETYASLPILSAPTDRPAARNADLNLALRGWAPTHATLGLIEISGAGVAGAPQLTGLFENYRAPKVTAVYRVYSWDWKCNCKGGEIDDWSATLVSLAMTAGEGVYTPDTGADIGSGYRAMVLYAEPSRVTLKYTREDSVVKGYAIHIENVSVDPNLLALYQQLNNAGRKSLPVLKAHQRIGSAADIYIHVALRDTGAFMDPRSKNDWWTGR